MSDLYDKKLNIDNYDIFINLDEKKLIYDGYVIIRFEVLSKISLIELDCVKLKIKKITLDNSNINYDYDNIKIIIKKEFDIGTYVLKINFEKYINKEPYGLYWIDYKGMIMYCTQFEPENCRYFIPCFDRPDLKSTFNLSVLYKKLENYICLSNMEIIKEINIQDKVYVKFNSTPKMSNYLLCFVIGPYVSILNKPIISKSGVKVSCYCFASEKDIYKWTIEHFVHAIDLCEAYFDQKYILPKLDYVMVPNFDANAMENWGLIVFDRENNYLKTNLDQDVLAIINTIYHEIIHQWIGNMVTNKTWKDLWINESITSYLSWLFLRKTYLKMKITLEYYLKTYSDVLFDDCFTHTQPIKRKIIFSNELFNKIIYHKGIVILNYLIDFMGDYLFMKAMRYVIKQYKYSNIDSNEIINCICKYQDSIDSKLFRNMVIQNLESNGFPLLIISFNRNQLVINKYKFNSESTKNRYPIDIFLSFKIESNGKEKIEYFMMNEDEFIYNLNSGDRFLYANIRNNLLCIIKYENGISLTHMKDFEIFKYIDDTFSLAVYGYLSLDDLIQKIKEIYNVLNKNNRLIEISYLMKSTLKILKLLKCFIPVNKIGVKFNFLNEIILQIDSLVKDINPKSILKYELVNIIYKFKTIYFKDQKVIENLYEIYLSGYYDNLILDCVVTNIVVNYPDKIPEIYEKIIKDDNLYILYIIKSLQHINIEYFNYFINHFISIINFTNISNFFKYVASNNKIVQPVIKMICDNWKKIDERLFYEIINGTTKNLYDIESISIITKLIEDNLISNKKNNYLLNLDYLKTNRKIITRFTF